ncbi:MAG: Flp pilus assembly protein CpaB [Myxococcota bacterium]|jgi:pilus assembly protein CpaB
MEWLSDARQARAGDAAARERLNEYLTPFVHGVALAHAPHHVVDALVPRILAEAAHALPGVAEDHLAGLHYAAVARKLAREAAATQRDEVHDPSAQVTEARQVVARLRTLPESTRERLLLRLVEGIPGPEQAQVLRAMEGDVKTDLERGAAEAARLLGQPPPSPGDTYLWELAGTPGPLVARLEMLLPVLRFDGSSVTLTPAEPRPSATAATAATFLDLSAVGALKAPVGTAAPPADFPTDDETTSAHLTAPGRVTTEPGGTEKTRNATDLPAQALVNPFEPAVPTMAATDLPAAAHGVAPAKSDTKLQPLTAAAPASSPSRPPVPDKPSTQKLKGFTEPEATKAEVPPALVRTKARAVEVSLEGTDTGVPIVAQETRVQPIPGAAIPTADETPAVGDGSEPEPTRMQPMPVASRQPIPKLTGRSLLVGSTPFVVAGVLAAVAAIAGWTGLFTSEQQVKRSWTLIPIVVAAQDLIEGDVLTPEAIAVRQVPDTIVKSASFVKPDNVTFVLGQRVVSALQEGDPLCWSHLADLESTRRLTVQKKARAYTIPTPVTAAIGRHLKPGDRVDVVATLKRPVTKVATRSEKGKRSEVRTTDEEQVAVTVLQNILVLATGQVLPTSRASTIDSRKLAYTNVSLMVLPEEATELALAVQLGRLTLTLRAEDDHELMDPVHREWTNIGTLLTGERTKKLHQRRSEIIKVIRGERSSAAR